MEIPDYLKEPLEQIDKQLAEARLSLEDPELVDLAAEEIKSLENQKKSIFDSINTNDQKPIANAQFNNCILEFRPGPGGEEAKIWALDLMRLYTRFANLKGWKVIQIDEMVIKINGKAAFELLKNEAGVHRVQRVPVTEAQGRIHTSTASVAVLPEISPAQVQLKPEEIQVSFDHASSHGGQNVNKVSTAVRLLHKPTGIIVECQTQRFQEQNRKIAEDILRSKLWELEEEKRLAQVSQARAAIGRAMRSEKIRTYNFPQDRVTDHRIKKSWHNLPSILNGNIDEILNETQTNLMITNP
jgi:peptide chain release factor 1